MRGIFLLNIVFLTMIVSMMLSPAQLYAKDVLVIGHRSVPVSELSPKEVQKIYLGRKKLWNNGLKVVFVTLSTGDVSKKFLKDYVKKNPGMYKKYWNKKMFAGSGLLPIVFKREKDLVKYVANTKGAIGYVSSNSYMESVKILSVSH